MENRTDIFARIGRSMNLFSKTEKKIAKFVLAHPQEILQLSISELATQCGVSDTTVFRFCKQLDLRGYQDFRYEIMLSLSASTEVVTVSDAKIKKSDTLEQVAQKSLALSQSALSHMYENFSLDAIEKTVSCLCKADYVQFVGVGGMMLTALEAKIRFMQISTKFHADFDHQLQGIAASVLPPNSAIVVFSYSGSTSDIIEIVRIAKKNKATVIAVTQYAHSDLVDLSDIVILYDVPQGSFQGGSLTVKMALLYIIELLYTEYYRRNKEKSDYNKRHSSVSVIGRGKQR